MSKAMSRTSTIVFNGLPKAEQDAITSFLVQVGKTSIDAQRQIAQRMRSAQIDGRGMTVAGVALSNSAISYIANAIDASAGKDR